MESSQPIHKIGILSKALSEEIRIRILLCLEGGPLSLQHFADIFELAPSTLSKHLHILEDAGLTVSLRQGRWRLYQWPDTDGDPETRTLLNWVASTAAGDPLLQSDAARRAVAILATPVPLPRRNRTRVLFLCTGNSCRSQMAEALLRKRGKEDFEVESAGVRPRPIPALTFTVMEEIGISIRSQKPKSVMDFIGKKHFDYMISVCPMAEQHTPVFPGITERLYWPMEDPAEASGTDTEKIQVFRRVRDALDIRISHWLDSRTAP